MAKSFDESPASFRNLNDLFPILNEKVGLSSDQFRVVVENIIWNYNHLSQANIIVGETYVEYTPPGTGFSVDIKHRKTVDEHECVTEDIWDFYFKVSVARITTSINAVIAQETNEIKADVISTPLDDGTGYNFDFNFTIPRGLQGIQGKSFRNRGNYNETAEYEYNINYIDFVHYEGNVYCPNVEKTTPGAIPGESAEWTLMMRRGYGISNIEQTKVNGLVHTYTITLESGYQYTFDVTDGATQDISSKADKVANAVNGNFAGLDAEGNLNDSGKKPSDFIEKKANVIAGNFAIFDEGGDIVSSTLKPSDFQTQLNNLINQKLENNSVLFTIATDKWQDLADKSPYQYSATIDCSRSITTTGEPIYELINDNAVNFATYGFALNNVDFGSGDVIYVTPKFTFYAIEKPTESVNLRVLITATSVELITQEGGVIL